MTDNDPCPNDTNGDGNCGRKTCARCYPQYQPLPEPELTALMRDLTRMYDTMRINYEHDEWRWVLSPAMVKLLRDYAATISDTATTDLTDEATVFGVQVRVDEHATQPMLELRRD